ncbi:MAG: hypothetical protein FWC13_05215 [Oscillospiraceae bacterium]|nr:hypothetical protein [Oscillospiraceae bacterium]
MSESVVNNRYATRNATLEKMYEWLERVVDAKEKATPEELNALPKVAKILVINLPIVSER